MLIWGDARPKSLSYFIAELERTIITGHLQQAVLQGTIPTPFLFSLFCLLLYSTLPSSTHFTDRRSVCMKKCQDWGPRKLMFRGTEMHLRPPVLFPHVT